MGDDGIPRLEQGIPVPGLLKERNREDAKFQSFENYEVK